MPRIRSVHPDIVDDEIVAEMTPEAFRTWVMLWTHLDDAGRGIDSAKLWAGKLYPLNDTMSTEAVEANLAELAQRGLLVRYEVAGKRYLCAKPTSWPKYQKPQHPTPSRLPPIPHHEPLMSDTGASPVGEVGSGVGEESSRQGGEGESEGEGPAPASHPRAVTPLEQAAIDAGRRMQLVPPGGDAA